MVINIHSGTKISEGAKQEMARAIYNELLGLRDKDVRNLSHAEQKRICMLAIIYKGLAVEGKPVLPEGVQKVIAKATRDVTQGKTERDQKEHEDLVEAESHLTPEERKMLREMELEYKKAMEEYNEATREVATHIVEEKDPEKRKKMLEELRDQDPKMAEDVEKELKKLEREQARGQKIDKPKESYDEAKESFKKSHKRKGEAERKWKSKLDELNKKKDAKRLGVRAEQVLQQTGGAARQAPQQPQGRGAAEQLNRVGRGVNDQVTGEDKQNYLPQPRGGNSAEY